MKVLVAIDNRPSSQASLDVLVKMHWIEGTEIELVTVVPSATGNVRTEEESDAIIYEMESLALELRNSLRQCEILFFARHGDPKSVILDLAEQTRADLIVVGSNCKSTLERLLLGSVSQSVVNEANCPVIVAKTPCCLAREESPAFRTILVAIDNSTYSDIAVQWLANFQWAPETRFLVVAAVEPDTDLDEVKRSLDSRAWELSKFLNTKNVLVEIDVGVPQHSIINLAKEHYADLIVMGSHGHAGLKEMILGSVTHAVSHNAPCAVAVVHAQGGDDNVLQRSGAYGKQKHEATTSYGGSSRRDERRDDSSTHIMPGGF